MQESTVWTVVERAEQKLEKLIDTVRSAYGSRAIIGKEDEEFKYAIHGLKEGKEAGSPYVYAQLIKYKRERSVESFDLQGDKIQTEKTQNPPVVGYSNFIVFDKYILIEQKGNTLGQRQVLNALLEFYEKNEPSLDLGFMIDTKGLDEFIKSQERITLVRFSNIVLNPDNPDENIQRFEDIIRDSNSKNTEFSNGGGSGINKSSKIIEGGLRLSKMNKLKVKIEAELEGEKQVFNSSKGRNQLKEKVSYEASDRDKTVLRRFLDRMKELL